MATEHNDNIVFLHNIQEGAASQSYGIQVAKLAGIPEPVLNTAREQLAMLEAGEHPQATATANTQEKLSAPVPVAATAPAAAVNFQAYLFGAASHPVVEHLEELDPNDLTPRQALDAIYELQKLAKQHK